MADVSRVPDTQITEDMGRLRAKLNGMLGALLGQGNALADEMRAAKELLDEIVAGQAGRAAVPDELRGQKRIEFCRACRDQRDEIVTAEFIVWGKLCPSEQLGPRCYEHTAEVVGRDMGRIDQWAIFDLRPFNRLLSGGSQVGDQQ